MLGYNSSVLSWLCLNANVNDICASPYVAADIVLLLMVMLSSFVADAIERESFSLNYPHVINLCSMHVCVCVTEVRKRAQCLEHLKNNFDQKVHFVLL